MRCLQLAVRAPSVHNSQPWLFRLRPGALEVWPDWQRRLRVIDPDGRELLISVGAAVFTLRLAVAAYGRTPLLELVPWDAPGIAARVLLGWPITANHTIRSLAAAARNRHTNRLPFRNVVVPHGVLAELAAAAAAEGARLTAVTPADRDELITLIEVAELRQRADPRYRDELAAWTRPTPHRRDGLPRQALGPARRGNDPPLRDFTPNAPHRQRLRGSFEPHPTLLVLSTPTDGIEQWLRAGQALQRVLLAATVRGLAATPMTQPVEVPDLRLLIPTPPGWIAQLVLRIGHPSTAVPATPRRAPHTPGRLR